jgi:MTH538 TIR-like domain (DUF1863)
MARKTFFSFHYQPDVQRSFVVKNSQVVKDRDDAGFMDSSAFERAKNENPDSLKRFLAKEMEGSSVVCVLAGAETALRRWVRFEILQALFDGRGLMGIRIHTIGGFNKQPCAAGPNPFDLLGVYVNEKKMHVVERQSITDRWSYTTDFQQRVLPKWPYQRTLPDDGTHALSKFFTMREWSGSAHSLIGDWIESAAIQAGR